MGSDGILALASRSGSIRVESGEVLQPFLPVEFQVSVQARLAAAVLGLGRGEDPGQLVAEDVQLRQSEPDGWARRRRPHHSLARSHPLYTSKRYSRTHKYEIEKKLSSLTF